MYVLSQDLFNKTYYPKLEDHQQINKPWYIVDAEVRSPSYANPVCPQTLKRHVRVETGPTTTHASGGCGRPRAEWECGWAPCVMLTGGVCVFVVCVCVCVYAG